MATLRATTLRSQTTNENVAQRTRQLKNKTDGGVQRTALGEIGNNKTQGILGQ